MSGDEIDSLLLELKSTDLLRRRFAVSQLGVKAKGNPRVVRALVRGSIEDDPIAEEYIRSLSGLKHDVLALFPLLLSELRSKEQAVREAAAHDLSYVAPLTRREGSATEETLVPLFSALSDPSDLVRQRIAEALAAFRGQLSSIVVPRLASLLSDPTTDVRYRAILALRSHGAAAGSAADSLTALTLDPEEKVRAAAFSALVAIEGSSPRNDARVLPALDGPSVRVRLAILKQLRKRKTMSEPVLRKIAGLLGDTDDRCVLLSIDILTGQPSLTEPVVEEIEARAHHEKPELDARLRQFSRWARNLK